MCAVNGEQTRSNNDVKSMVQLSSPLLRYMTRKTYLFPQIRHVGFPKVAAWQYADARAAMRDRQRGNTQIVWAPKNLQK